MKLTFNITPPLPCQPYGASLVVQWRNVIRVVFLLIATIAPVRTADNYTVGVQQSCGDLPCIGSEVRAENYTLIAYTTTNSRKGARFSFFATNVSVGVSSLPIGWKRYTYSDRTKYTMLCNRTECGGFRLHLSAQGSGARFKTTRVPHLIMAAGDCGSGGNHCSCESDSCYDCPDPAGPQRVSLLAGMVESDYDYRSIEMQQTQDYTGDVVCGCTRARGVCRAVFEPRCTVLNNLYSQWNDLDTLRLLYEFSKNVVCNFDCTVYRNPDNIRACKQATGELCLQVNDDTCQVPAPSRRLQEGDCSDIPECQAKEPLCTNTGQSVCNAIVAASSFLNKNNKFKMPAGRLCSLLANIQCTKTADLCALARGARNCNHPREDECFRFSTSSCVHCCFSKRGTPYVNSCLRCDTECCKTGRNMVELFTCPCADKSACGGLPSCVVGDCAGAKSSQLPGCP